MKRQNAIYPFPFRTFLPSISSHQFDTVRTNKAWSWKKNNCIHQIPFRWRWKKNRRFSAKGVLSSLSFFVALCLFGSPLHISRQGNMADSGKWMFYFRIALSPSFWPVVCLCVRCRKLPLIRSRPLLVIERGKESKCALILGPMSLNKMLFCSDRIILGEHDGNWLIK